MGQDKQALVVEHGCLLRHWAGLQARVTIQCHAQQRRCAELEAELVRWRARWMLATTQLAWGLGWPRLGPLPASRPVHADEQAPATDATRVICQTGCAGHAHPWRDDEGHCRLTGGGCARVPPHAALEG